jgi:recombination protein RecT
MTTEAVVQTEPAAVAPKPQKRVKTVQEYVRENQKFIEEALPNIGLTAEAVARTALSQIYKQPKLQRCDHVSIMRAIIEAASLGLSFSLGRAYLVPFNNKVKGENGAADSWRMEAQFMLGYQGLVDLVRRSASVKTVVADAVYEGDKFTFRRVLDTDVFEHEPLTEPTDGKLTHTYCLIRFNDGGYQIAVLTKKQIDKVRARSKSKDDGPWVTDYARMAIKTAVKLCTKLCPASIELSRAIELDNDAEIGEHQQLGAGGAFAQIEGSIDTPVTEQVSSAAEKFLQKTKAGDPETKTASDPLAAAPSETKTPSGETITPEPGGESPTEKEPESQKHRGRPKICKVQFCGEKLASDEERESGYCNAKGHRRMWVDAQRAKNDTAPPPRGSEPTASAEPVDPNDQDKSDLAKLCGRLKHVVMVEVEGDVAEAEIRLSSIMEGRCQKFEELPEFLRLYPKYIPNVSKAADGK